MFNEKNKHIETCVSNNGSDGAFNMVGRNVGFVKIFTSVIGHRILPFHCIIHQ